LAGRGWPGAAAGRPAWDGYIAAARAGRGYVSATGRRARDRDIGAASGQTGRGYIGAADGWARDRDIGATGGRAGRVGAVGGKRVHPGRGRPAFPGRAPEQ